MKIGEAIKALRKKQGLSQEELAKSSFITQTALSQIENGARPSEQTLSNISKVLKIPEAMIHLLTIKEDDIPESKKILYDRLFPVIKSLIIEMAGDEMELD